MLPQLPREESARSGPCFEENTTQALSSSTKLGQSQISRSHHSHSSAHHLRSRPLSKRSSFLLHNGAGSPPSPWQSRMHCRTEHVDPYMFYSMCKGLFDPPATSSKCHYAESDLNSSKPTVTSNINHEARPVSPALEQLTIDWTLPSTRHHESARIEAATRGLRGCGVGSKGFGRRSDSCSTAVILTVTARPAMLVALGDTRSTLRPSQGTIRRRG